MYRARLDAGTLGLQRLNRFALIVAAFLAAVKGEGRPLADVSDGVRVLDLALAVEQAVSG